MASMAAPAYPPHIHVLAPTLPATRRNRTHRWPRQQRPRSADHPTTGPPPPHPAGSGQPARTRAARAVGLAAATATAPTASSPPSPSSSVSPPDSAYWPGTSPSIPAITLPNVSQPPPRSPIAPARHALPLNSSASALIAVSHSARPACAPTATSTPPPVGARPSPASSGDSKPSSGAWPPSPLPHTPASSANPPDPASQRCELRRCPARPEFSSGKASHPQAYTALGDKTGDNPAIQTASLEATVIGTPTDKASHQALAGGIHRSGTGVSICRHVPPGGGGDEGPRDVLEFSSSTSEALRRDPLGPSKPRGA